MAPFSDEFLFIEMANKVRNATICSKTICWRLLSVTFTYIVSYSMQALFWQQQNYYGVDLTPLFGSAHQGYFSQVHVFSHQQNTSL